MQKAADLVIKWAFYTLFFFVPLVFFKDSFELFEYNKMMLTYALAVIIGSAWLIKMICQPNFNFVTTFRSIRRTPFDIPIMLYLLSHVLSTVFSIDVHTSLWGYYSRYHEGLFATLSYLLLFYAAVSNLTKKDVLRIIFSSFAAGVIVSLYGALEHFGNSPSCLMITGKFDDSCWIQDVKGRVFATLGQPNWMAAYLDVLILTALGFVFRLKSDVLSSKPQKNQLQASPSTPTSSIIRNALYIILIGLFFVGLIFTKSRSGLLGLFTGLDLFLIVKLFIDRPKRLTLYALASSLAVILFLAYRLTTTHDLINLGTETLIILTLVLMVITVIEETKKNFNLVATLIAITLLSFIFGLPFSQTEKFSLENILGHKYQSAQQPKAQPATGYIDIGISESGDIRKIVWRGAVKVWQRYPLFGSGVETFAYSYYLDRPVEHNMVSEWDFLYNKAHNEFLNILATTGTVGFLTYLSILSVFTLWFLRTLKQFNKETLLITALFAAYLSILVTNFFGFSVVIIGLFFFLIPAFCLILSTPEEVVASPAINPKVATKNQSLGIVSWIVIAVIICIALYFLWALTNMWQADKAFAYGKNVDSVQQYTTAYSYLNDAVNKNPDEPNFRDELSYNEAILALALFNQATGSAQEKLNAPYASSNISASTFVQKAIADSNIVVTTSPNVLQFWKTRTKVFYTLAEIDRQYLLESLNSIQKATQLAPTDAKVHYNYGLLLGQANEIPQAIQIMQETANMKPNYGDAYYALGLYYAEAGQKQKAKDQMLYILNKIGADDRAKKWLEDNP